MSVAAQAMEIPLVTYTIFPDVWPKTKTERADVAWDELVERVKNSPTYIDKRHCPLISIAEYGELMSGGDNPILRHGGNIKRVFGCEIDYDGAQMPIEEAASKFQDAGICALLYTSPSHKPDRPRWRALLPFSEPYHPQHRMEYTGRANRVLGGVATRESFTLSQSFYIGRVTGAEYIVIDIPGQTIDFASHMEPLYWVDKHNDGDKPYNNRTDADLRACFTGGNGGRYEAMLSLSSRWAARGMSRDDIEASLHALLTEAGGTTLNKDGIDLTTRVAPMARSAVAKFGESRAVRQAGTEMPASDHDNDEQELPPPEDPEPGWHGEPREIEEWGAPVDLWKSYPAPSLKPEWLPCALHNFVTEQAALTGTDAAIVGISAIVACASVIHDGFKLCPQQHNTTWRESARLWAAVVGDPSTKKSPGMTKALSPLRHLDAQIAESQELPRDNFEIASKIYEKELNSYVTKMAKGERACRPEKPEKPAQIRLMVEDTTVEALSEILADNPRGVMVFRDELSSWFGQMDAYNASGGGSKDRGNWLEVYNGGPRRIDRIGRGNKLVPNWSACVLGGIQPDPMRRIASKLDHDGLMQRFMVIVGRTGSRGEDRKADLQTIAGYAKLIETLHSMEPRDRNEDLQKEKVFRLSAGAQSICNALSDFIHNLMISGGIPKPMMSYLGKWDGLFARLLCAYHVIAYAADGMHPVDVVDEGCARAVDGLMRGLLLPHGLVFYGDVLQESDRTEHAKWIAGMILTRDMKEIRISDVAGQYKQWRSLPESVRTEAWKILLECEWIKPDYSGNFDRLTRMPKRFKVNPVAVASFTAQQAKEMAARKASRELMAARVEEREGDD